MNDKNVNDIFKSDAQSHLDYTQFPILVKSLSNNVTVHNLFDTNDLSNWQRSQDIFMRWTADDIVFTQEYIERDKNRYDDLFEMLGFFEGNVLDIGGGWGLLRQWWKPENSDVFIVHDPGVERFLRGPHELHQVIYERAFKHPMIFVEGFGEDLPYHSELFNICIIVDALDHCIDPKLVLAEAYRCLKFGGSMIILQTCTPSQAEVKNHRASVIKRFLKNLKHPKHLLSILYGKLFYRDLHMHHFSTGIIEKLMIENGFVDVNVHVIPAVQGYFAFQAKK